MASPAQQPLRAGCTGRWLTVIMVAAVVLALAALLAARAGEATASRIGGAGSESLNWQTYHDPDSLFALRLPPGWTAQIESATAGFRDSSGGVTESIEMITFENPSQGSGSAKLWVIAYPIKDASAHQYYCRNSSDLQPFSPMSLSSIEHLEDADGARLFTTDTASFQIDVTIPGVMAVAGYRPPQPPATPVPTSWLTTDQTEMQAMLTSFQPTDPKPLSC